MGIRIDLVRTSGQFTLDGQSFDVENNVWLVGDDEEVIVIDAAHDHVPIIAAVNGRRVRAIVLTHGHNDHITAAVALREATGAPIWFNPADGMLWDVVHPDSAPDRELTEGTTFDRSASIVVSSPCPVLTTVSAGSVSSRVRIDSTIVGWSL